MGRGERGLLLGRLGAGRGLGIPGGVGFGAMGAGRARGRGSIALCRRFRARRPSGLGVRWRFVGFAGRGTGT